MTLQRADVREHWERMKPLVVKCQEGSKERPEDIYAGLRYGKACLYVCDDGFTVLWPLPCAPGEQQRIEVTCAARWGDDSGVLGRYHDEVAQLAREAGAKALVCRTNRKEVNDFLAGTWKFMFAEYELEL